MTAGVLRRVIAKSLRASGRLSVRQFGWRVQLPCRPLYIDVPGAAGNEALFVVSDVKICMQQRLFRTPRHHEPHVCTVETLERKFECFNLESSTAGVLSCVQQ
jgi:hypothetical protein